MEIRGKEGKRPGGGLYHPNTVEAIAELRNHPKST
jgi:hypothetical protein